MRFTVVVGLGFFCWLLVTLDFEKIPLVAIGGFLLLSCMEEADLHNPLIDLQERKQVI